MDAEPATGIPLQKLPEPVRYGEIVKRFDETTATWAAMGLGTPTSNRQG
jgi:hypothetical protein